MRVAASPAGGRSGPVRTSWPGWRPSHRARSGRRTAVRPFVRWLARPELRAARTAAGDPPRAARPDAVLRRDAAVLPPARDTAVPARTAGRRHARVPAVGDRWRGTRSG